MSVLTLAQAKAALRIPTGDVSNDADLQATYMPAVDAIVQELAGPQLAVTNAVLTVDGGMRSILLPSAVTAIVSITESGAVLLEGTDFVVNKASGIVYRGTYRQPYVFLPGLQNIVVTYNAGAASAPTSVILAARIILRQLWQADQQGARPAFGQSDNDTVATTSGALVPKRAVELLRATPSLPGFA